MVQIKLHNVSQTQFLHGQKWGSYTPRIADGLGKWDNVHNTWELPKGDGDCFCYTASDVNQPLLFLNSWVKKFMNIIASKFHIFSLFSKDHLTLSQKHHTISTICCFRHTCIPNSKMVLHFNPALYKKLEQCLLAQDKTRILVPQRLYIYKLLVKGTNI